MTKLKTVESFTHLFTPLFPTLSTLRSLSLSHLSNSNLTSPTTSSNTPVNSSINQTSTEQMRTTLTTFLQTLTIQQQHLLLMIFTSIPIYDYRQFDDFSHLHSLLIILLLALLLPLPFVPNKVFYSQNYCRK